MAHMLVCLLWQMSLLVQATSKNLGCAMANGDVMQKGKAEERQRAGRGRAEVPNYAVLREVGCFEATGAMVDDIVI